MTTRLHQHNRVAEEYRDTTMVEYFCPFLLTPRPLQQRGEQETENKGHTWDSVTLTSMRSRL